MSARFTSRSLFFVTTILALACGWAVDHFRTTALLRVEIEKASIRERELKNGVRTVVDATESWHMAEAYRDAPAIEFFEEILVYNLLYDLWQLYENESQVNSLGGVPADYWAYKILVELNCHNADDFFEFALSLDQLDNVPDATYIEGNSEYKAYRKFIEKAFTENSDLSR